MPNLLLLALLPLGTVLAEIPIKGGCVLGQSQAVHGLSPADAEAHIREYARLYVKSYSSYKREERDVRRKTSDYLELEGWTQADVVGFTHEQRELLYISVASELAVGKIDSSELPGYVVAIEGKIDEIEVELGCE